MSEQVKKLNLEQKLVEIRKLLPYIQKTKKEGSYQKYKSYKLDDILSIIQIKMNELQVNTRITKEENAKTSTYDRTLNKGGTELMFVYESDLTIEWINADDPQDKFEKSIHCIGWQNDPSKAKGTAYTYAFKFDLAHQFTIPMGETDPDTFDHQQDAKIQSLENNNTRKDKNIKMMDEGQKKVIKQLMNELKYTRITAPERMKDTTASESFSTVTFDGALMLIASLNQEKEDNKKEEDIIS